MPLQIASLNSGSNGNCYYVGNGEEAVLVDAGLPCRELERRMKRLGLDINRVKGIFISHEHTDHISGLGQISNKYNLHVYGTARTLQHGRLQAEQHRKVAIKDAAVTIGALTITAFRKQHDAVDPVSFTVSNGHETIGVFTDIGAPCAALRQHFSQCHAAFLESNYCAHMLASGRYPAFLKTRITGGRGHLSNAEALEVFQLHRAPYLSHLLLAHLSQENNHPNLVADLFGACAGGVNVAVASRYAESAVYEVAAPPVISTRVATIAAVAAPKAVVQATLF